MRGMKISNEYAKELGELYAKTPKAVFAAIAVSVLTQGGEQLEEAKAKLLEEWDILYGNGILTQKPPK